MALYGSRLLVDAARAYVRYAPGMIGKPWLSRDFLSPELKAHALHRVGKTRFGAKLAVDTQDLVQRFIYMHGVWEPNLTGWLQSRLKPGDTFVDVGANVGYFSVLASRLVGDSGHVVAIEASPTIYDRALRHFRFNGCRNVRAVNEAVSEREEVLRIILASSANLGAASVVPYEGHAEGEWEVKARKLGDILTAQEAEQARVIKVDVEGAEGAVIKGMEPLLDRLRPDAELVIEVAPERMATMGASADDLLDAFTRRGFHAYRMPNSYDPGSYPVALRHGPFAPVRWDGALSQEMDVVFSKVDAATLP